MIGWKRREGEGRKRGRKKFQKKERERFSVTGRKEGRDFSPSFPMEKSWLLVRSPLQLSIRCLCSFPLLSCFLLPLFFTPLTSVSLSPFFFPSLLSSSIFDPFLPVCTIVLCKYHIYCSNVSFVVNLNERASISFVLTVRE